MVCAAAGTTFGCDDNSDDSIPFDGVPLAGRPATAGMTAPATTAGSGGAASAAGAGAGAAGTKPTTAGAGGGTAGATAGAGGMSGGGAGGAGGMSGGAGGAGGAGGQGSAGMSGGADAMCKAQIMAAGRTIGACEECLCGADKCQAEIAALDGDANGNALVQCTNMSHCSGQCCLCGATCSLTNYAMGPCAAQTETAAGVTPGAGIATNGTTVMMNCAPTGPADNSCARSVRLGECTAMKCMTECGLTACQ